MHQRKDSPCHARTGSVKVVKLLVWIAGLAAALTVAAPAGAGGQSYLSWTLGQNGGKPTVTWQITGSTKWYVADVQIGTRPAVNGRGDLQPRYVIAYAVFGPGQASGTWQLPYRLGPDTYYGLLTLRYDGPCEAGCESHSSVRSFTVAPPRLGGFRWTAEAKRGKVVVRWKEPAGGWYVSVLLVDDARDFASPEDATTRPSEPSAGSWRTGALKDGTYYVRLRARYAGCDSCLWSATKKVRISS
jgi:hypothetical protein